MIRNLSFCLLAVQLAGLLTGRAAEVVIGDFGGTNLGDWARTGTAFNAGPVAGDLLNQLEIENARGHQVASSEIEGDGPTGTLTSPEFKIVRKYISFLVGGGDYERDTCVNLLLDGKIVRSATGWRSDRLVPASWDVSRFVGQNAQVQIVDAASGDEVLPLVPAGRLFHIQAEVSIPDGAKLIFKLRGVPVVLTSKTLESGTRPASVAGRIESVELLVDRASLEAFVNRGEISSTRFVLPNESGLSIKAEGGTVIIKSLVVYQLNSAWTGSAEK